MYGFGVMGSGVLCGVVGGWDIPGGWCVFTRLKDSPSFFFGGVFLTVWPFSSQIKQTVVNTYY